ncbi:hypothetical protein [Kingella potus]|uniref:hypothetical protein n=1 Tax=Kingella potus TaxID=265175 RepID=UPI000E1B64AD|nr:hypothetical protein [Kingella potus]UOP00345.1 hypothetical protein LVJ84_10650 [Kingella potus]
MRRRRTGYDAQFSAVKMQAFPAHHAAIRLFFQIYQTIVLFFALLRHFLLLRPHPPYLLVAKMQQSCIALGKYRIQNLCPVREKQAGKAK